jgi:multimeric flavodoxin WrbA
LRQVIPQPDEGKAVTDNTVCLLGSPRRNGNSDTLAHRFVQSAIAAGSSVETFALSELTYNGCLNLLHCKNGLAHCGQNDDLTQVLAAIEKAQMLVLASPVYFTGLSGQMKLAIDRFFSFFVPGYPTAAVKSRLSPDRHLVLIQTQGEPEERYADLLDYHAAGFNGLGYQHLHLIRAWGVREPGDVNAQSAFLKRCDTVAGEIYRA